MSSSQLRVNIFGAEYVLRADDDNHDQVIEIARYVDQKMREIDRSQAINSNLKLAILSALNMAEELFETKIFRDKVVEQLNEEARKLNRSLEEALDL